MEIDMMRFLPRLIFVLAMLAAIAANPLLAQEDLMYTGDEAAEGEVSGPIEEYVAGYTPVEGMFDYYFDETTRRVLISVDADQLDKTYLASVTLNSGTGGGLTLAPMMWDRTAFEFRRDNMSIEFVEPNYQLTTVLGEPMAGAVEAAASDYYFGRAPIEVEDESDGRVVFDLATFLLASTGIDPINLTVGPYAWLDYEGSYISDIRGFPMNDEIDIRAIIYGVSNAVGDYVMGGQEAWLHISLSELPPEGYMPRLADERVGYFLDMSMNYSVETDSAETRYLRYINRWRLEKEDPSAEISDPVEPITFWLENTIPYEYRDAIRDGILLWNKAFEAVGFRNAMRVREMPEDADWDPADIRYNCIRWFVGPNENFAIGPSLSDPRTGELYAADIGVSADMARSSYREYELNVKPLKALMDLIMPPGWPDIGFHQVPWDQSTLDLLEQQAQEFSSDGGSRALAAIRTLDLARSFSILETSGVFQEGTMTEDEFVLQYLTDLVVHEVGHTLGLRHNFASSSMTSYFHINQPWWTRQHGVSGSVMDYTVANIAPRGEPQGEYFNSVVGDYDMWAIEYGYKPLDAATPEDEIPALEEIASRSNNYRYATDHQVYGWSRNPDPDIYLWDLTDDPIRYGRDRLRVADQLIEDALAYWSDPGTMPSKIRQAFLYSFYDYVIVANNVPREIGGIRIYRNRVGDEGGTPAMVPVSAEDQRRALDFINEKIWSSDSFQFSPEILNMLGRDQREYFDWMSLYAGIWDFDLHDWVLMAQTSPLYWIYDPVVLTRLLNNEQRMPDGEEVFTMSELFDTVRDDIWSEVATRSNIDSFRRNLQRAWLEMITNMYLEPANGTPEDAVTLARHDLILLRDQISSLLDGSGASNLDTITVAHLEECLSRINLTLEAPMGRGGNIGFIMLF